MITWDERLHYIGGWFKALPWRRASLERRLARLLEIDLWAWQREVDQHDPDLSPHQVREAMAWGWGARDVLRLSLKPYPSPPYPDENEILGIWLRASLTLDPLGRA